MQSILQYEPAEVVFRRGNERKDETPCCYLTFTNVGTNPILYRLRLTRQDRYAVKQSKGTIVPGKSNVCTIFLRSKEAMTPNEFKKDKFMLEYVELKDGEEVSDIARYFSEQKGTTVLFPNKGLEDESALATDARVNPTPFAPTSAEQANTPVASTSGNAPVSSPSFTKQETLSTSTMRNDAIRTPPANDEKTPIKALEASLKRTTTNSRVGAENITNNPVLQNTPVISKAHGDGDATQALVAVSSTQIVAMQETIERTSLALEESGHRQDFLLLQSHTFQRAYSNVLSVMDRERNQIQSTRYALEEMLKKGLPPDVYRLLTNTCVKSAESCKI